MSDFIFDFINQFNHELTQSNPNITVISSSPPNQSENYDCNIISKLEPSNKSEIDSFLDNLEADIDTNTLTVINPYTISEPLHKNLKRSNIEKSQDRSILPSKQKKLTTSKIQPHYTKTNKSFVNTPNLKNTFNIIIPTSTSDNSNVTYTQSNSNKNPTLIGGNFTFSAVPTFVLEQSNLNTTHTSESDLQYTTELGSQHTTNSTLLTNNTNILTTAIKVSEIEEPPQLSQFDVASHKPPVNVTSSTQLPHVNMTFVFFPIK